MNHALPGDAVAIPILFDGVAGNVQHTGNLPLAHPVKPHSAYVFVNFQCDYHLCTPPITISDYYKGFCVMAQLFVSVCSKMAHLYISVYIYIQKNKIIVLQILHKYYIFILKIILQLNYHNI